VKEEPKNNMEVSFKSKVEMNITAICLENIQLQATLQKGRGTKSAGACITVKVLQFCLYVEVVLSSYG
jgi:hypothetical protein